MYATGKNYDTIIIDTQEPFFRPYIENLSRIFLSSPQFFTECGVDMGFFDPFGYQYLCLEIADINKVALNLNPYEFPLGYKLHQHNIDQILAELMDSDGYIYRNLLAYCLLKYQPTNATYEIWDVCVLKPYRKGEVKAMSSVGKNFISNIINSFLSTLASKWWLIVRPDNIPAAAIYIKNGFRIFDVTRGNSIGEIFMPSEFISMILNIPIINDPSVHQSEIEKFTKLSKYIIEINSKRKLNLFFPPETIKDIKQIVNYEGSELAGRFAFKIMDDGSAQKTVINGEEYYNVYVYDEIKKGDSIKELSKRGKTAVVRNVKYGTLMFHTHPFSVILGNNLLLQIPSNSDISVSLYNDIYVVGDVNVKETFVLTIGGFFSICLREDSIIFFKYIKDKFEYYYNVIKELYSSVFINQIKVFDESKILEAALGETIKAYKLLKTGGVKDIKEYKIYNNLLKKFFTRASRVICSLTLETLFSFEESITLMPILRGLYRNFQSSENFIIDEDKISLFNFQFFGIDEKAERDGLVISIDNSYHKVVQNYPPLDPSIKLSPIGDCSEVFDTVWWDHFLSCYSKNL